MKTTMETDSIAEIVDTNPVVVDSMAELLNEIPELKIEVRRPSDILVDKYRSKGYHYVVMLDPRRYYMIKEIEKNVIRILKFNRNNDFEVHAEYQKM